MIEVQCSSCHTLYRIDERVLPTETPTFKCSRCGHVFVHEPRAPKMSAVETAREAPKPAAPPPSHPAQEAASPTGRSRRAPLTEASSRAMEASSDFAAERERRAVDPLEKPFVDSNEQMKPGVDPAFEFVEEEAPELGDVSAVPDVEAQEGWQVGEGGFDLGGDTRAEGTNEPEGSRLVAQYGTPSAGRLQPVDFEPPKGRLHSSGWFLGLFFFVAIAFGGLGAAIIASPDLSTELLAQVPELGDRFIKPVPPGKMAALRDVSASFQLLKEGPNRPALLVSGVVRNMSGGPLHAIRIAVELLDGSGHGLAGRAVYCGNTISSRMIGDMTRRELDFFQRLDPPKGFALGNDETSPFLVVFVDPPAGATRYRIAVVKAQPDENQTGAAAGS